MRGTARILTVVLALPLFALGATATGPALDFAIPAQAGPTLQATQASWALVVMASGMDAEFALGNSSDLVRQEHERLIVGDYDLLVSHNSGRVVDVNHVERTPLPATLQMAPQENGPVSFYIEGANVGALVEGATATLDVPPGACISFLVSWDDDARWGARADQLCPGRGPSLVARPATGDSLRFRLSGTDVRRVQWHNMQTACDDGVDCPPGGAQENQTVQITPTEYVGARRSLFEEAVGPARADVAGWGEASLVVFGGPGLSLGVDGWIRLPLASGDAGCPSCLAPANQTFTATGNLSLMNLQMGPNGGLRGDFAGKLHSVRFDEQDLDPSLVTGPVALVAAAATASLAVLFKLLSPLFTRHKPDGPLENERRRLLYDFVVHNPGVHFREAMRAVGIPAGSGRHHVTQLVRAGLLVEHRLHSKIRLFENSQRLAKSWKGLAALRNPVLRELHNWVERNPGSSQKDILTAFQASGWNPSTTKNRLDRLVRQGMLSFRFHGRYKLYSASIPN